ncbi:UDP-N-acetylmuramyl-tripeptide synthetase [Candidatus Uhrbacteria bacterium]|nr:UDP-N-acetylmuramyl-tripeptide synthetase [Candidatus Uhrbacteria bacterium]
MKRVFKKLIPTQVLARYHFVLARTAAVIYGHPSEKMIVIGVTGTSGKSSVVHFLRQILESAGWKVGALSTVEFCVAGRCQLNDRKMTMLGRFQTQGFLRKMARAGCTAAIVETTSEGYLQYRHRFINYDIMVLTNLYPEHLESHGGFENYKAAKLGIFRHAAGGRRKTLSPSPAPHPRPLPQGAREKIAIVNGASEYADEFLAFPFDKKIKYTVADALPTSVPGEHTPQNVAAALTVARELDVEESVLRQATSQLQGVPGRIEMIPEAEKHGFRVIVDYAFEPVALAALYQVVAKLHPQRIIHVLGSCGGGRDRANRSVKGRFAAERAAVVIVTNEDPYDDDPLEIIDDVAAGAEAVVSSQSSVHSIEVLKILDRKEAIGKALTLAQKGDLVLITGKGSEQAMCVAGGKKIPWDDRKAVREELKKL